MTLSVLQGHFRSTLGLQSSCVEPVLSESMPPCMFICE